MKILSYKDLKSTDELLPLLDQAFGWSFNSRTFANSVKIDPRLKNSEVGFCAMDDGRVIGYVGVMDLVTRTLDGSVEHVGGLYGVATLPGHTRRGVCTSLMIRAHEYFKDRGYRFSLLNTSPTIVAYSLYKKLGYLEAVERSSGYKVVGNKKPKRFKTEKLDFSRLSGIYDGYVKDRCGFVVRDEAYFKMLKKAEWLVGHQNLFSEHGYVLFKKEKNIVRIAELMASDAEEMNQLISLMEEQAKDIVLCRTIVDKALLRVFKRRGYMILEKSHGATMFKSLTSDASFKQTYGDKFFMSSLDHF